LLGEAPDAYVVRIAAAKSQHIWQQTRGVVPVLSADTSVVLNGMIMGKPSDKADGLRMLKQLSGTTHKVFTAVSLRADQHWHAVNVTEVSFRILKAHEIEAYWQTGEPLDKAGAYAIQGRAGQFVNHIAGSFSGVVGLPLFETAELLTKAGIAILDKR
jgi:septum formation protein